MENMATDVICGDFFDHIDDLLDFPNDDDRDFKAKAMGGMMPMETPPPPTYIHSDCGGLLPPPPTFPSPPMDAPAFDQKFDDLDIADLEWVSNFMDDSASSFNLFDFPAAAAAAADHNKALEEESLFQTPSPVSVLESNSLSGGSGSGSGFASSTTTTSSSSSSSSSTSNFCYPAGNGRRSLPHFSSVIPARARTKRPRPAAARAHVTTPFLPTTAEPESFDEAVKKAKKKTNPLLPSFSGEGEGEGEGEGAGAGPQQVRKCMHCEIQKTPQWRAGPMGPKTLCNACGVRYKSGRLFPEYRPAASPTFVPSLHSNSHKKVVEMRINATAPNSCDLLDYIRRRE